MSNVKKAKVNLFQELAEKIIYVSTDFELKCSLFTHGLESQRHSSICLLNQMILFSGLLIIA